MDAEISMVVHVPSSTTPDVRYPVTIYQDGTMVCSCKASRYNRTAGRCKHLHEARALAARLNPNTAETLEG